MDVDFAANREYYSDSEHIVPALEGDESFVVDTENFSVPNVGYEPNDQKIEAVCRLKVSRIKRNEFFPLFELVNFARDHPGLVEKVIMQEAATRERFGSIQPINFIPAAIPRLDGLYIHKQELLDRAYELVHPHDYADEENNAYKLYYIDHAMGFRIPDEYAWAGDEYDIN